MSNNVFQLSALSQNDPGASDGSELYCKITGICNGTLRKGSSAVNENIHLPVPPGQNGSGPTPTWFLIPENGLQGSFSMEIYCPTDSSYPSKTITMPSQEVTFTMSNEDLSKLKKAAGVIGAPDMVLEKNGSGSSLTVKDKKNDTANNYSLSVDTNGEGEFNFFFKVENMKLLDGTYDVEISSKNISHYTNKSSAVEYWIALEPESTYTV